MMDGFKTPVIVILFNRPDCVRNLVDVLRQIRPVRVLAIADGPRPDHPADVEACRAARRELEAIDWPCTMEHAWADDNLGCDERICTGLDWAFARVSRAIILEDDILPHPSFFPWAECMLDRFQKDPNVFMISGHNPLGRWPLKRSDASRIDHVRARRGSVWGWATTAAAWRALRSTDIRGTPEQAERDLTAFGLDPLVASYFTAALEGRRRGVPTAWDMLLGVRLAARRGAAIVSPVNLVRNTGINAQATRSRFTGDFSSLVPAGPAPLSVACTAASELDPAFDRAAVLIELMGRCVNPRMAYRLARSTASGAQLPVDPAIRRHLAPFLHSEESLELLDHLAALGVRSESFDRMRSTLMSIAS